MLKKLFTFLTGSRSPVDVPAEAEELLGSRVRMVASVGEHEAGKTYLVPDEVADAWIASGYAAGVPSRPYTPGELRSLRREGQVVSFSG